MVSEYEGVESDPKERTALIWLGVIALLGAMIVVMWMLGRQEIAGRSVVRARHILISFDMADPMDRAEALKLATDLRQRILDGESFKKLAREYSSDTFSAARGGDLGFSEKGTYVEAFENFVWEAPLNTLSDVILTSHGFHIIIVEERQLSEAEAYEQNLRKRVLERGGGTPSEENAATP